MFVVVFEMSGMHEVQHCKNKRVSLGYLSCTDEQCICSHP